MQSKDVELSWNTLEEFGLREKLSQLGDIKNQGDPAWWMNKSPLRSFELGRGRGRTASELGIKTVAHDTRDFYLWSVITASRKGRANMFESRPGVTGEMALHGRGVYTVKNSRRGWGAGFTIRFEMNPMAREGSDFEVNGDVVRILNRNALEVIPDSLEVASLMDYLQLLKESKGHKKVLLERLRLKIDRHYYMNRDKPEIKEEIKKAINFLKKHREHEYLWRYFSKFKIMQPFVTELIDFAITLKDSRMLEDIAKHIFSKPYAKDMGKLISRFIDAAVMLKYGTPLDYLAMYAFSEPHIKDRKKLISKFIDASVTLKHGSPLVYLAKYAKGRGEIIEKLIKASIELKIDEPLRILASYFFPYVQDMDKLIEKTIKAAVKLKADIVLRCFALYTFSRSNIKNVHQSIEHLIKAAIKLKDVTALRHLTNSVFSRYHVKDMSQLIEKLIAAAVTLQDAQTLRLLPASVFAKTYAKEMDPLVLQLIKAAVTLRDGKVLRYLQQYFFTMRATEHLGSLSDLVTKFNRDENWRELESGLRQFSSKSCIDQLSGLLRV